MWTDGRTHCMLNRTERRSALHSASGSGLRIHGGKRRASCSARIHPCNIDFVKAIRAHHRAWITMSENVSPILIVWDSQTDARLSGYITEILHVEGYNWFTVHDLATASITVEQLARHPVVILTHIAVPEELASALLTYVDQGGALIALRPPESLASALGLHPFNSDLADRYIALNSLCALNDGVGLPPLQFHGRAELYLWHGEPAHILAYFAASPDFITKHPAITVGKRGQGHMGCLCVRSRREYGAPAPGTARTGEYRSVSRLRR